MAVCFKCNKIMESSISGEEPWEGASGGVVLGGGGSFGSTLYDSLMDGIKIEVILCDNCLLAYKDRLHEVQTEHRLGNLI